MTKISFLDKVKSAPSSYVYLVKGEDQGIECWYYVDVTPLKVSIFKKDIENGETKDLLSYGRIIVSGWGTEAPEYIKEKIEHLGASYNPEADPVWQTHLESKNNIYFVQAKDNNGEDFHAYVAVHGSLADKFIEDATRGNINVNNYGEVVLIDWGFPTEETKREMTEKYGVDHNYIDSLLANAQA